MGTVLVVKLVTPDSFFAVVNPVHHGCCVQHGLEALDMHVDLFIILGQMGVVDLVDEHP
jgi:hypothetical protein